MKVFLATPITGIWGLNHRDDAARLRLEHVISSLRRHFAGPVFCAIEREQWGQDILPACVCTPLDMQAMRDADLVVAIPGGSYGVHVELGWASALGRPIFVCVPEVNGILSPLVDGLPHLVPTQIARFVGASAFPSVTTWDRELLPQLLAFASSLDSSGLRIACMGGANG
jgi:nucleoside 2-deoxyribosyltransferase